MRHSSSSSSAALFISIISVLGLLICPLPPLLRVLHPTNALTASTSTSSNRNHKYTTKDEQLILQNGIKAQVISSIPTIIKQKHRKPPILFLHGSFHGAWCWQEKYIPFFVEMGYPCIAYSWRGTGGTPVEDGIKKVKIVEDHCDDLQSLLDSLPSILGDDYCNKEEEQDLRPIVISHSMGGIIVMKYLEEMMMKKNKQPNEIFSGIISMCSVPPSGNGKSTIRVIRRSFTDAYRITIGFVLKKVITDESICRQCFFGGDGGDGDDNIDIEDNISGNDIKRYQSYFERDSKATLDVTDLSKVLPSKNVDTHTGRASFVSKLPPCLVIGATDDFIVDEISNMETANYYGIDEPVYIDSPHDVMLGPKWRNGANTLKDWIENTSFSSS
jgi:hypothetical protein